MSDFNFNMWMFVQNRFFCYMLGHVERMEGERLVKKIYRAEVEGNRRRGRPRRRWMDEVKGCLSERGLSIPEAEECVKDRREWRRIVGGRRR